MLPTIATRWQDGAVPVAEDLQAPARERILNPLTDGLGRSAIAHEHRLLSAARPALPFLNWKLVFTPRYRNKDR